MGIAAKAKQAALGLLQEFQTLWFDCNSDFVPWCSHKDGGRLFSIRRFGRNQDLNCRRAPLASAFAEFVGAIDCGYSVLLPGTHIESDAEMGFSPTRVHVGLVVPSCG